MKKVEFKKIVSEIKPSGFTDYRLYFKKVYHRLKNHISPFSYDKFTELCGLGQNNVMYHIIHGSRPLSVKNARKIADCFGLKGDERSYLVRLSEYQNSEDSAKRQKTFQDLLKTKAKCLGSRWDEQSLEFFNHWYHGAVYELLRFDASSDDPAWLSRHLKPQIPESKVRQSLKLLEACQMIQFDEVKGRMVPTDAKISTGREIRGIVFKSYHQQMINLALGALSRENAVNRDISSVTVGIAPEGIEELKQMTAEFRQKLLKLEEKYSNRNQIMQINIQAFPLTKEIRDEPK